MFCLQCGKNIGNISKNRICPYCGTEQYSMPQTKMNSYATNMNEKSNKRFSDKEILALGLYPKDEGYKMSLISKIVGRK